MQLPRHANPAIYRFSEGCFRRYEPIIAELVAKWPAPLIFEPQGLRPTTTSSRLRDAIVSVLVNKWETKIDTRKLFEIRDLFKVTFDERKVYITHRSQDPLDTVTASEHVTIVGVCLEVLHALLVLASYNHFSTKHCLMSDLDEQALAYLRSDDCMIRYPNVVVEPRDDNTFLLL